MATLDIRDKKILYELDINSRENMRTIGKKVRLSQQAVENRIRKMIENKMINSFQTIVAYHKFSYSTYIIYLSFQNTSSQKEIEIIEKIKREKNIIAIWSCEGIYDLLLVIHAKSIFELNNIITNINNLFGNFIRNYDIVTNIGAEHYSRNYLINTQREIGSRPFNTGGEEIVVELDEEDYSILYCLIQNPRINFVDMSSKLNLTVDIIRYRFKKLVNEKIIQGFSVVLNHKNFGYLNFRVLFKLKNTTEQIKESIFNFARTNNHIRMATKSFGTYELALDIEIEDNEKLRNILLEFRNKFNEYIQHYDILNIYSIEKYITFVCK